MTRVRGFVLVLLATIGLVLAFVYVLRSGRTPGAGPESVDTTAASPAATTLPEGRHLYVRSTRLDDSYGRLVIVPLNDTAGPRVATALSCDRLDVAGGTGVCLTAKRGVLTTYSAVVFREGDFSPVVTVPLAGIPSRVRVSPNGELAGITVFVSGHAYSQTAFSTMTILLDTRTGQTRADLESFVVEREGRPIKQQDFNFWGITFARDSNTFYATVSSGGRFHLIRGDAAAHKAEVIADGIECPSLSPDNTRVAFKKRETANGQLVWRLALLDLATRRERLVSGEARSVDDQVEWLDDEHILYATPNPARPGSMIVSVANTADGTTAQLLTDASSPSVP